MVLFVLFMSMTASAVITDLKLVKNQLKQAGAVQFSKTPGWLFDEYEAMYVGYDKLKKVKVGIMVQVLKKSYRKLTAYVVIVKKNKKFIVQSIIIPDLKKIKSKKGRKIITKMIVNFKNFKCVSPKHKPVKIDAVSGATFCHKNSYRYINEMARLLTNLMVTDKHKNKLTPLK